MEDEAKRTFQFSNNKTIQYTKNAPKRTKRIILTLIAVFVFAGLIFGGLKFFGVTNAPTTPTPTPTPTQAPVATSTPTPTPTISGSPTPPVKGSPTPTKTPTPTGSGSVTGLDRSNLSIAVQNGSGVSGAAAKASDYLKGLGYKVLSSGNAPTTDYQNVSITIKSASSSYLTQLKTDLSKQYTVGSTSATLSSTSNADAVVVIGK